MHSCVDCGKGTANRNAKRCWKCYTLYRKAHRKIKLCIDCGVEIGRHTHIKRCRKCYGITERGKKLSWKHRKIISTMLKKETGCKNRNWKGEVAHCMDCGKQLRHRFSKRCLSCNSKFRVRSGLTSFGQVGAKSSNWQNGKSFEKYSEKWTRALKREVRWRDGFQCVECGTPESECLRKLDIHHIDYNKRNVHINNLVSLCGHCHRRTNFDRDFWKKHFEEKTAQRRIGSGFLISNVYKM
jgi:hypothetical protein